MTAFLYLAGLVIGAAVFIYLYATFQEGKDRLTRSSRDRADAARPELPAETVAVTGLKRPPGTRICPLCAKELTQYEALYASQVNDEQGSRILIYGCPYCYKKHMPAPPAAAGRP